MRKFERQVLSYAEYHRDTVNKLLHFVGVPLVIFSILVPMAWLKIAYGISGATVFYLAVFVYYMRLDRLVGALQFPFTFVILALAEKTAAMPFKASFLVFSATFIGGWTIQLVGHYFEGRRPALVDNFLQIFNAPLFLTVEVMFALGFRRDLREKVKEHNLGRG